VQHTVLTQRKRVEPFKRGNRRDEQKYIQRTLIAMNWIDLNSISQIDDIWESFHTTVIFKHSTRCPVSGMAKRSLEFDSHAVPSDIPCYYLDILQHRDISNKIAEKWQVIHESPQILVVQGSQCIHHASHDSIDMATIVTFFP